MKTVGDWYRTAELGRNSVPTGIGIGDEYRKLCGAPRLKFMPREGPRDREKADTTGEQEGWFEGGVL